MLSLQKLDDALLVTLNTERLDAASAIAFKDNMRAACPDHQGQVVLDLSNVSFMDSSGLGAVVAVKKLLGNDTRFVLVGLGSAVAKVFRLTRMDSVFEIHAEAAGAIGNCHVE